MGHLFCAVRAEARPADRKPPDAPQLDDRLRHGPGRCAAVLDGLPIGVLKVLGAAGVLLGLLGAALLVPISAAPLALHVVTGADTFFIATADAAGNADASHRGGMPGFVAVHGPTRLSWPDYVGNAMFMTLGNLEGNPRAGLLFIDFSEGTVLQMSGTAQVAWDPARTSAIP